MGNDQPETGRNRERVRYSTTEYLVMCGKNQNAMGFSSRMNKRIGGETSEQQIKHGLDLRDDLIEAQENYINPMDLNVGESPIDHTGRYNTNVSQGQHKELETGPQVRSELRYAKLSERIFSSKRTGELKIHQSSKIKGINSKYPEIISKLDQHSEMRIMTPPSPNDRSKLGGGILQNTSSALKDKTNLNKMGGSSRKIQIDSELREKLQTDRI